MSKNRRNNNRKGPQPKAKMWNNRSVLKQDKTMLNAVSRRHGKHAMSSNCETICRNILDKNGKAIAIVPPVKKVYSDDAFNPQNSRVCKGQTEWGKKTFTVECGTQGFGFLIFYPQALCLHNVVYTRSGYTQTNTSVTSGTSGLSLGNPITSQASHLTGVLGYTTKAQITVCSNNTALLDRSGKIATYIAPRAVNANGQDASTLAENPWGVINSVSLLESEQEINMNFVNNSVWSQYFIGPPSALGSHRYMLVCFKGLPNDSFDVEVTQARYVFNSSLNVNDCIPRTITPIIDQGAWNHMEACSGNIEAFNSTFEEKSKAVKETYDQMNENAHREQPTSILKTLLPIAKEVLPSALKYFL